MFPINPSAFLPVWVRLWVKKRVDGFQEFSSGSRSSPKVELLRSKSRLDWMVKNWDGVNKDRESGKRPVLFANRKGVEFEDQFRFYLFPDFPVRLNENDIERQVSEDACQWWWEKNGQWKQKRGMHVSAFPYRGIKSICLVNLSCFSPH